MPALDRAFAGVAGVAVAVLALLLGLAPAVGAQAIAPDEAARRIGEQVVVEGEVPTVVCSPLACLLSFSVDYSGLVASIPGDAVGRFPPPKETYGGRRVRVRGTVVDRNGRPRIEVTDPADLQVVGGDAGPTASQVVRIDPARQAPSSDAPADAPEAAVPAPLPPSRPSGGGGSRVIDPGRVVSRAGGPREPASAPGGDSLTAGLSGGPEDVATVEARALQQQIRKLEEANAALSDTVAALEERLAVLEQSGVRRGAAVDESELPYLPEYVVPGDSGNRLQHVKRGWSAERVLRALGAPLNTTTEANGYMTWYYADGRAVSLDPRGRVVSSIGF